MSLPNLRSVDLKALQAAFGLATTQIATACGCSDRTVRDALRGDAQTLPAAIRRGIRNQILTDVQLSAYLGIDLGALYVLEQNRLAPAQLPLGPLWWLPRVREWAREIAPGPHRTMPERATAIATALGLDPDEDLLRCDMCMAAEVDPPDPAWRRCSNCQHALCGSRSCGARVFEPDAPGGGVLLCSHCLRHGHVTVLDDDNVMLAGMGNRTDQLINDWEKQRESIVEGSAHHISIQQNVENVLAYFRAEAERLEVYLRSMGTRIAPSYRGVVNVNLKAVGELQANTQLLLERVRAFEPWLG